MLKTFRETLENKEKHLPVISDKPTLDELQQLLENHESVEGGFFKDVYETEQKVVKLPDHAGAMADAEDRINRVAGENIAPETNLGFYDLRSGGYRSETPVIVQEKYDFNIGDLSPSDVDWFIEDAINVIDTALRNDIVLQDAKITNFGLFDQEVNYIDIADKESLIGFNPPEERSEEEHRAFQGNAASMYNAFTRSVSQKTNYTRDQIVDYTTQHSPLLDESVEIELPELSLMTGLEQRLKSKVTGKAESSY